MRKVAACAVVCSLLGCATTPAAEPGPERERYAPTPESIRTPPEVETRIGTLRFFDGLPDADTVEAVYEHLDFVRAVRTYLQSIPGVSMMAMREGMDDAGMLPNYTILLTESLMNSKSLFLTQDSETVYALAWISLKGGPIVVETAPRAQGVFVDAWQRPLAETGKAGPDRGRGGRYVIVPPAYAGYVPRSKFAVQSPTFGVWAVFRGFLSKGSPQRAVESFKTHLKIYPLKESERPPPNMFADISDKPFSTVPPNDFTFFELLDDLVQAEPNEAQNPETLGLLASIGIEKGRRFEPDASARELLTEAARVGDATARALLFAPRDANTRVYEDRQWQRILLAQSERFLENGARLVDARARFHFYATGVTTTMTEREAGSGLASLATFRDSRGQPLDGGRTYTLSLPPEVPAAFFWSLTLYDNQTRSMLQTNQRFPSIVSGQKGLQPNDDGSITLRFGPREPRNRKQRANWIQTVPDRGWNAILRLYGPEDAWFERSWQPGDVELVPEIPRMQPDAKPPRMYTEATRSITLPERLDTRIGPLELEHGIPTGRTVERLYEHLDFIRGVDAYLTMLPGASSVAMRRGLREAGLDDNDVVGVFSGGIDPHSLFLTPSAESVHALAWLDLRPGAFVVESPPDLPGIVNDSFHRHVADLGATGPDEGEGGLFLFVPPKYEGQISELYFNFVSSTYGNLLMWRDLRAAEGSAPVVERLENHLKIYPLEIEISDEEIEAMQAAAAATTESDPNEVPGDEALAEDQVRFVDLTGKAINTVPSSDYGFYDQVHELVQEEPVEALGPELLGLLRAIGIEKGKPLAPSGEGRRLLAEAAAVANATARALAFRPRDPNAFLYEQSRWRASPIGNSHRHERRGVRLLDARTTFSFLSNMTSPAMVEASLGEGSRQAMVVTDSEGAYLNGANAYALTLPANVPAKDFWSIVLYDPQTRSMLQAPDSQVPSVSSRSAVANLDGTTTIYFRPDPPPEAPNNWIQTVPGKGWFAILRLYGPLKSWFDESWKPGDIEPIR